MKHKTFDFFQLSCIALLSAVMMACSSKPAGYSITGTAEGTEDGDTVFLCEMQGFFNMIPVDTAIIENGQFRFEGQTEGASIRFLMPIHNGEATTFGQIVLENADIKATLVKGDGGNIIEGGPESKIYAEFEAEEEKFSAQINEPWETSQDTTKTEAERQAAEVILDSLNNLRGAMHKQFIIDHLPSGISDMLLGYFINDFSEEDLQEVLKLMGEKQPDMPVYKTVMAEREAQAATAVGQPYTDLEMDDPEGKSMKLSQFVGKSKLILVDFWASWCGPCRAEMPNVVKAYNDYHSKGFEVIGVSFDNDKDAWQQAIAQLSMPWPQMSDLKGWESAAAAAYSIRAIPSNVLLDEKGTIVAKDLRGDDLSAKLAELLGL